jgi:hypothetical protein
MVPHKTRRARYAPAGVSDPRARLELDGPEKVPAHFLPLHKTFFIKKQKKSVPCRSLPWYTTS